jgi:hypothetical protein
MSAVGHRGQDKRRRTLQAGEGGGKEEGAAWALLALPRLLLDVAELEATREGAMPSTAEESDLTGLAPPAPRHGRAQGRWRGAPTGRDGGVVSGRPRPTLSPA